MEGPFTAEDLNGKRRDEHFETACHASMCIFKRRIQTLSAVATPVVTHVFEQQGDVYENILVPVTDGKLVYNIRVNLKEAYESQCDNVVREFQKSILLHNIDEAWKENLRELDELKKSVQNASYEQKDPLLIFKLESGKLFDPMVNPINTLSLKHT